MSLYRTSMFVNTLRQRVLNNPLSSRYPIRHFYSKSVHMEQVKKKEKMTSGAHLSDEEVLELLKSKRVQQYQLEEFVADQARAVNIRRQFYASQDSRIEEGLKTLPHENIDYSNIYNRCCENVVGFIQIPVGLAGPILLDGQEYLVPMATTEGALVASTHRGCKAITMSGGATSAITNHGMTRAPVLKLPSLKRAIEVKEWLKNSDNFTQISSVFNSTSRFARLAEIKTVISGRNLYLRFKSSTGDAMGMNMVSKGTEKAIDMLREYFPDIDCLSLSGNLCTDKKPSAINWIEGRGNTVICEAVITKDIVESVLKTTPQDLVALNVDKNYIGSALAGSIGGFNAHASNIVTAIYLATGQDPAQNVESSNCLTLMELTNEGQDLYISVTMPSVEVGTVGGGTHLPAQSACLEMLGVKGSSTVKPGLNSETLARVVAATTLAGELSLMSALSAGHLVRSHLKHNRKQ